MLYATLAIFFLIHLGGIAFWAHLLASDKRTGSMLIWTFWLLLFPLAGIPLYLLLGTDRIRRKRLEMHDSCSFPGEQAASPPKPLLFQPAQPPEDTNHR